MNATYIHIEFEDLIEDRSFVQWVQDNANNDQWMQWVTVQEIEVQSKIQEARILVASLSNKNDKNEMEIESINRIWNRINTSILSNQTKTQEQQKGRVIPMWAVVSSIAAAVVLLFMLRTGSTTENLMHQTTESEMAIILPASSKVILSPQSKLDYNNTNWDVERTMTLEGRASFDVSKGVPFSVYTDAGSVHVLGTAFEVIEEEGQFIVDVERGKVRVESGLDEEILTKGMSYLRNPTAASLDLHKGTAKSYIRYDGVTLAEVKLGLSALYNITFEGMESDDNRTLSTITIESDDLQVALKNVFFNFSNIEYKLNGSHVLLSNKS